MMQKSIYNVKLTRQVSGRYFSALTKVTFSISIYSIPACISGVQSELQCNGCTTGMIGASLSRTSLFGFFFSSKGEVFVLQCHSAKEILYWSTKENSYLQTILPPIPATALKQCFFLIFNGRGNLFGKTSKHAMSTDAGWQNLI